MDESFESFLRIIYIRVVAHSAYAGINFPLIERDHKWIKSNHSHRENRLVIVARAMTSSGKLIADGRESKVLQACKAKNILRFTAFHDKNSVGNRSIHVLLKISMFHQWSGKSRSTSSGIRSSCFATNVIWNSNCRLIFFRAHEKQKYVKFPCNSSLPPPMQWKKNAKDIYKHTSWKKKLINWLTRDIKKHEQQEFRWLCFAIQSQCWLTFWRPWIPSRDLWHRAMIIGFDGYFSACDSLRFRLEILPPRLVFVGFQPWSWL